MHVRNLTFTHSNASSIGGAIQNNGTLTVTRSRFLANTSPNGGAIGSTAGSQLFVDECTFDGNSATGVGGGAVIVIGSATIADSTFTGNSAAINGGAINVQGNGNVVLENLTFSANSSGSVGGAVSDLGTLLVSDSTFSANSGSSGSAVGSGASSVVLNNNVFADNTASGTPGALTSSLTGSNNVFFGNTASGTEDDLTGYGTSNFIVANTEPLLPLGDFGGPTLTMQPVLDGAAICAASPALLPDGLVRDQRGYARMNGNCLDAGAVQTDVIFRNGFEAD
jgi:predicted outer membrane repeat protein